MIDRNVRIWSAHLVAASLLPRIVYYFLPETPPENLIRSGCLIPIFMLSISGLVPGIKNSRYVDF